MMKPSQKKSFPRVPSLQEILEARMKAIEKNLTETRQSFRCPFCNRTLTLDKDYIICPHCLKDLKTNCPFCGELIPTGSTFCEWCGNKII